MMRSELDKAYADEAWSLKPGQVSKIVESSFGFHIIQMIERRGDRANTRHILMNPKADANAKQKAIHKLDSLKHGYRSRLHLPSTGCQTIFRRRKNQV